MRSIILFMASIAALGVPPYFITIFLEVLGFGILKLRQPELKLNLLHCLDMLCLSSYICLLASPRYEIPAFYKTESLKSDAIVFLVLAFYFAVDDITL
jgi:hypothetical protein